MPSAVASSIVEIASHMIKREYVKAHDAYITCAIGNAPWPMGITGTGVHERQGRQHIRSDKIVSGTRLGHARPTRLLLLLLLLTSRSASVDRHT